MDIAHIFVVLLLVLTSITATLIYTVRVQKGMSVEARPLLPLVEVNQALNRAAETGRPLHLTPGAGSLSGRAVAPETFAGLVFAQRLAEAAAKRGAGIAASSGNAVAHLALRGTLRQAYYDAGNSASYDPTALHLYAHDDTLAFAAGLGSRYLGESFEATVAVGAFGPSYLLIGAQGAQQQLPQIAGTTSVESLAAMALTSKATLMGEESYAAEAYLIPTPAGFSRLLTQDLLRTFLIAILLAGIVFEALKAARVIHFGLPL